MQIKKKLGMIFTILSSVSCQHIFPSAPTPPVVKECGIIESSNPYLYCRLSDGSTQRWRVPIRQLDAKYSCTDARGYADIQNYIKAVDRWTQEHCGE